MKKEIFEISILDAMKKNSFSGKVITAIPSGESRVYYKEYLERKGTNKTVLNEMSSMTSEVSLREFVNKINGYFNDSDISIILSEGLAKILELEKEFAGLELFNSLKFKVVGEHFSRIICSSQDFI